MASQSWSDTSPAVGDKVGEGDDRMRDDRKNVRERLVRGGHWMVDTTYVVASDATDDEGKHVRGIGAGPDIYKSDKTTKLVAYPDDNTVDMTNATTGILGPGITTGTNPGHKHTGTISLRVAGALTAGRIKVAFRAPRAMTFVRCQVIVFTAPTAADITFQAYRLLGGGGAPANTTNRGAGGDAFWLVAANKPKIISGQFAGITTTFDNVSSVAAGEEIVFEIESGAWASAADLTINFEVDRA